MVFVVGGCVVWQDGEEYVLLFARLSALRCRMTLNARKQMATLLSALPDAAMWQLRGTVTSSA